MINLTVDGQHQFGEVYAIQRVKLLLPKKKKIEFLRWIWQIFPMDSHYLGIKYELNKQPLNSKSMIYLHAEKKIY